MKHLKNNAGAEESNLNLNGHNGLIRPYCLKCTIGISGAAETGHCAIDAAEKAEIIGREVAKSGRILVTGATTGMPYYAAKGAKSENGFVVGFSPAASESAHVKTYHLPTDYHDVIVYTGFEYAGRDLLLTRSSDAVILICGRIGTLHEFTVAFEDQKPIGILTGSGGTVDMIEEIVNTSHRSGANIIYDSDPKRLLEKVLLRVDKQKMKNGS